jgi:uncharacterized protein YqeY
MAKNDQVQPTDAIYETVGRRTLKNLRKSQGYNDTEDGRFEIETIEHFLPSDPNLSDPLDVIVGRFLKEHDGEKPQKIMGLIMKATQGRFKAPDVTEEMQRQAD